MQVKLCGDRVLIRKDPIADRVGSIWLADRAKRRPQVGTVVAVGPNVRDLAIGDRVLVGRYAGVDVDGTQETVYWQRDVIAVITEGG